MRHSIDLLLKNSPGAYVTRKLHRYAAAGWGRQGNSVRCVSLVGKSTKMPPSSQLDLSSEVGITLFVVPGVLQLSQQERRIVDPKVHAVAIAQLRIVLSGPRLIPVKDAPQDG